MTRRDDRLALAWEAGELPLPAEGAIAVFRAIETELFGLLGPERFSCQQGNRPLHDRLAARGLGVSADGPDEAAAAIVVATRQRADTLGALARALAVVPPGATVAVTGARTDGIDALMRQIGAILPLEARMAKAHGRVFTLCRPERLPPEVAEWEKAYRIAPNAEGFLTGPGMFGPERADAGSGRLAGHCHGRLAGRVADLGAGWGWLAVQVLAENPGIEEIDLFEAEARALEAARCNVGDPRARFHWADVTRLAREPRYDWVVTNPPFHQGRAAEPELGAAFIAAAARVLKPNGRLLLVANRTLPYEAPLGGAFKAVTRLAEDAAFKVFLAERPLAAPSHRQRSAGSRPGRER